MNAERDKVIAAARAEVRTALLNARRTMIKARYDAAQTVTINELHWQHADHLDPHSAASPNVRRILRSRSRYEVIENNPWLKGVILTIANDFVGTGPKLQITDPRIPEVARPLIHERWAEWSRLRKLRQKLWRARVAKIVDGETFLRAYSNTRTRYPVTLDFQVLEADRITSEPIAKVSEYGKRTGNEIDGVRFDQFENPEAYYVLRVHPGLGISYAPDKNFGDWIDEKLIIHWFRQDRGWLRGIPETTPSLPLCAILRRYTMAVLIHQEVAANNTAIIETDGPPSQQFWTEGGVETADSPFETFPIEMGMVTNMPYGYKFKQLACVPPGASYDEYVGSLLREITRPILVPFHMASGTAKESNMASAIVDQNIYKGGQKAERTDCDEFVSDKAFDLWWEEARLVPDYFGPNTGTLYRDLDPPKRRWRWDSVGLDHTDPQKVAAAIETMRKDPNHFTTDRDIQETIYNRSLEEWQDEVRADMEFRNSLPVPITEQPPDPPSGGGESDE